MKRVSIKTYHDTRQKAKANGRWPVKLVVYCPQVTPARKPYALHWPDGEKCEVTPDEYRRATGERVPSALQPLAALIGDEMSRARKIIEGMQDFSHEAFARAFVGGTEPLCIINDLQAKAASFLTGSGANYRSAASALARYTNKKTLSYNAITPDFAQRFVTWLEQDRDLSGDTSRLYVGVISAVINDRKRSKDLRFDFSPFMGIQFRKDKKRRSDEIPAKVALDRWKKILAYSSSDPARQYARDVFVLCTLLNGIYPSTLLRIRREDIQGEWIFYTREKTKRRKKKSRGAAFISPDIKEVLDRMPVAMPYLIPGMKPGLSKKEEDKITKAFMERINAGLEKVCDDLKIPPNYRLTIGKARHTFGTISKLSGTPIDVISEILLHSDSEVTEHYLSALPLEKIEENARRIAGL